MSVTFRRIARSAWSGTSASLSSLYPALALLLTAFAVAPLAFPGFFQSYTGYRAVYNLIDFDAHLGTFWNWSPMWGHTYDLLRLDGPLGYWLAEIFHRIGISFLDATKLTYALSFLVAALGMFALARRVFQNDAAALLASIVYIYFPAHIATVYIRGAFGEALAWGLFPVALLTAIQLQANSNRTRRDLLLCILAFAALVLAQPGLALLFAILARVWILLSPRATNERGFFRSPTTYAILLGIVLGIVLLLPSILQQSRISTPDGFTPAFVYPFQFLSATWGTAFPGGNFPPAQVTDEQAPYQIGIAALGLTILAIALLFRPRTLPNAEQAPAENPARRLTLFALIASVVFLVLMTPLLAFLWEFAGLDLFVQYPSQLLTFVGFLLSLVAASVVLADIRFQEIPLLAALGIIPILAIYPYLAPSFIQFSPTKPALARFNNDEIALLDAKIIRPPGVWRHGATVQLALTWQALRQPNRDYTVFLHILDTNGKEWGSTDEKPQGGALPTLKWTPGQVISDTHSVQIDLNGPPEGYHLELGIYQATTSERAPTETGATEVMINETP